MGRGDQRPRVRSLRMVRRGLFGGVKARSTMHKSFVVVVDVSIYAQKREEKRQLAMQSEEYWTCYVVGEA